MTIYHTFIECNIKNTGQKPYEKGFRKINRGKPQQLRIITDKIPKKGGILVEFLLQIAESCLARRLQQIDYCKMHI